MNFFIIALVGISIIIAFVPHFLYAIARIGDFFFHYNVNYKPFGLTALALVVLWIVVAMYGHYRGRFLMESKSVQLHFAALPESFDGYKIVHISDLHLDGWQDHDARLVEIVDSINAKKPDAILFTGDIVSLSDDELTPFMPILSRLKAKDGVYSILGNHDYLPYNRSWSDAERHKRLEHLISTERQMGWHVLLNDHAMIHRGTDSIAIVGSENQSMGIHSVVRRGNLAQALQGTDGAFRILMTHDPTHWRGEVLPQTDIPLTLSGHTHGGQMRVFGLFHVSTFIYKEHAGLYNEGDRYLNVSTGIGGTMPMRVGLPAEIVEIELKK